MITDAGLHRPEGPRLNRQDHVLINQNIAVVKGGITALEKLGQTKPNFPVDRPTGP